MDISRWAFKNRNLVQFLIAVLMVGGIFGAYQMSKLEDPEVKVKTAMVVTMYPGASAHQVELEVTDVLEKAVRTVAGVGDIESYSYNDYSLIQIDLLTTVMDKDVEQCWDVLRRRVAQAQSSFPSGVMAPTVLDDFGYVYGMFYALTGDGLNDRELSDYAELIKREVIEIDGVERIELYGKRPECINISLLQDRMANLGVLPAEVLVTLNGQNQTNYTGYFENGESRIRVTVSDKFKTVDDIGNMLIQGHNDDQLRLRDIARIEKDYENPTRNELFYNQQRSIGLLIAASSSSDIVKVGAQVEKTLKEIQEDRLPAGVECHKVFNQSERVKDSLGTFAINLVESVLIVIVILMLTMGFKSGLIIGYSLIITVLGSFLFLHFMDGTMQRVSLGAFILAMGMLVDNAIVIIDGILVDLKSGKSRIEALTSIGRKTAMPLLGATLIAIIAFLPIYMSPDTAGVYVRDLFIVLGVSLLLSWVLALIHVPLMANTRLPGTPISHKEMDELAEVGESADKSEAIEDTIDPSSRSGEAPVSTRREYPGRIYGCLRSLLTIGLRHRWGSVIAMIGLLVLSGVGFRYMKQGFFPDMVYDQMYMEYKLPEGTNSDRVLTDLNEIEDYLKTRPEITNVTTSIGGTPGRYNLVRSIANPSLAYGELIIDFVSPEALVDNMDEIQQVLTARYPQAYVKMKRYNLMYKKFPIEAQFLGPDPAVLHHLADSARLLMEQTPEVECITTNWEPDVPVLTVEYDQPAARALGLSRSDVSLSLLTATSGIPIGSFYQGIHRDNIYIKCLNEKGNPIEDLNNTQVFSQLPPVGDLLNKEILMKLKTGALQKEDVIEYMIGSTPLQQVSRKISLDWEPPVIPRFNGQRSQRVQCSPIFGVETDRAFKAVSAKVAQIHLPEGYSLNWQGEKSASEESMKYLFANIPLGIILMISILIMLFKDYRKPIIIFCCLPFVIVGVVIVMLLTGKVFNFVAIVGTLGLVGMLIKNGIVLMDEINSQIASGIEPVTALIDSAQSRLRPVMMASLTTILGMIPLLPDAMFGSLAASIMGGLLFSTVITLLFIPVLYALFFHIKVNN